MAGKRLVMGPSPGTGLFMHDVEVHSGGRNSNLPVRSEAADGAKEAAHKEEERVHKQLVNMLERKCSKLQQRVEHEEQHRARLDVQVEALTSELEELRRCLHERNQELAAMTELQHDLVKDRQAAAQQGAALQEARRQQDEARLMVLERERDAQRQLEMAARAETEWKDQVVRLVAETRNAERRTKQLEEELCASRNENDRLTSAAQDLLRRFEAESAQRLELEEKCLELEVQVRDLEQRSHGDLEVAQQRAKQQALARQRAEEVSQRQNQRCEQALRQLEHAEGRCRALEARVQRLQGLCSERKCSKPPSDESQLANCRSGAPPPMRSFSSSRPPTGGSVTSATSVCAEAARMRSPSHASARSASGGPPNSMRDHSRSGLSGPNQKPLPGAIRRAGSTPQRRLVRSVPPALPTESAQPAPMDVAARAGVPRSQATQGTHFKRPCVPSRADMSAVVQDSSIADGWSPHNITLARKNSTPTDCYADQATEAQNNLEIEDGIPTEPEDSSLDDC